MGTDDPTQAIRRFIEERHANLAKSEARLVMIDDRLAEHRRRTQDLVRRTTELLRSSDELLRTGRDLGPMTPDELRALRDPRLTDS